MKMTVIRFVVGKMLMSKNLVTRKNAYEIAVNYGFGMDLLKGWNA